MTKKIVLIRHEAEPVEDRVSSYLAEHGFDVRFYRPFRGEELPMDEDIAGCVIFGGLYNVYDIADHPFLLKEYAFIQKCFDEDVPMLGICQGAQMIAWHLGAEVGPTADGLHEFGYYELQPTAEAGDFLPSPIHVVQSHWHGFDLPDGATRLAASALFPNQAFRIGDKVYGFQFHAEVTPEGFRGMQERGSLRYGLPGVQPRSEQDRLMALHDGAQAAWFKTFLQTLLPNQSAVRG
jgi:GMP synthase (glutamine-hydrolysing)